MALPPHCSCSLVETPPEAPMELHGIWHVKGLIKSWLSQCVFNRFGANSLVYFPAILLYTRRPCDILPPLIKLQFIASRRVCLFLQLQIQYDSFRLFGAHKHLHFCFCYTWLYKLSLAGSHFRPRSPVTAITSISLLMSMELSDFLF